MDEIGEFDLRALAEYFTCLAIADCERGGGPLDARAEFTWRGSRMAKPIEAVNALRALAGLPTLERYDSGFTPLAAWVRDVRPGWSIQAPDGELHSVTLVRSEAMTEYGPIEAVAKAICRNLGLDPDEHVSFGVGEDMTPAERAERLSDFTPDIALFGPRWRLWRGRAAEAIATRDAVASATDATPGRDA